MQVVIYLVAVLFNAQLSSGSPPSIQLKPSEGYLPKSLTDAAAGKRLVFSFRKDDIATSTFVNRIFGGKAYGLFTAQSATTSCWINNRSAENVIKIAKTDACLNDYVLFSRKDEDRPIREIGLSFRKLNLSKHPSEVVLVNSYYISQHRTRFGEPPKLNSVWKKSRSLGKFIVTDYLVQNSGDSGIDWLQKESDRKGLHLVHHFGEKSVRPSHN